MEQEIREIVQEEMAKLRLDEHAVRDIARDEVNFAIKLMNAPLSEDSPELSPFQLLLERAERLRKIADGVDGLLVAAKKDPALHTLLEEMLPHQLF